MHTEISKNVKRPALRRDRNQVAIAPCAGLVVGIFVGRAGGAAVNRQTHNPSSYKQAYTVSFSLISFQRRGMAAVRIAVAVALTAVGVDNWHQTKSSRRKYKILAIPSSNVEAITTR